MDWGAVGWLIGGVGLGAGFLHFAAMRGRKGERRVQAVGLIVAGLIYVGFAAWSADPIWIVIEGVGTAIFAALALAGVRWSAWPLALGWALHPVWDAALHLAGAGAAVAPRGYVLVCVSFDLLVALRVTLTELSERGAGLRERTLRLETNR